MPSGCATEPKTRRAASERLACPTHHDPHSGPQRPLLAGAPHPSAQRHALGSRASLHVRQEQRRHAHLERRDLVTKDSALFGGQLTVSAAKRVAPRAQPFGRARAARGPAMGAPLRRGGRRAKAPHSGRARWTTWSRCSTQRFRARSSSGAEADVAKGAHSARPLGVHRGDRQPHVHAPASCTTGRSMPSHGYINSRYSSEPGVVPSHTTNPAR